MIVQGQGRPSERARGSPGRARACQVEGKCPPDQPRRRASLAVGLAGVLAAAAPLGVPSGRPNVTPVEPTGIRTDRIPGGLQRPFWLPGPSTTRERPHAGFSPARGVINVPPPAPVRVCVCGLVSGVLCQMLISSCDAWRNLGHTRSRGGRTGLHSVSRGLFLLLCGSRGCLRGSSSVSHRGASWVPLGVSWVFFGASVGRLGRVSGLA